MSREMKDSGVEWIGEIPKKWKISKVKYFVKCLDGKRIPIDIGERKPGPYPYSVSYTHLTLPTKRIV